MTWTRTEVVNGIVGDVMSQTGGQNIGHWIGWTSSAVLVLTIGRQVLEQWKRGTSEGVSVWLFVGQLVASSGLLVYSVLRVDPVFMATNALLICAAAVGMAIVWKHRRRTNEPPDSPRGELRVGRA